LQNISSEEIIMETVCCNPKCIPYFIGLIGAESVTLNKSELLSLDFRKPFVHE